LTRIKDQYDRRRDCSLLNSTPFHWQLAIGNTTKDMDLDHEVYGQSRSDHSGHIALHAGHLGLTHDHVDIDMDHLAPSISPRSDDDADVYGLSNLLISFHNKVNTSVITLVKVNTAYSPTH
jgi:hypothetical protein